MDFISNTEHQNQEMLAAIEIASVDELFSQIPKHLKLPPIKNDDGLSEFEGSLHMLSIAEKNTFHTFDNYLGAGSYEHYIPAVVKAICSKSEFLTSYTPYQAEASQGMLQCIFEYQSAICALTGMDVSNASLYDGASACAEALLMALRYKKERNQVIVPRNIHPHYRAVIHQYLCQKEIEVREIPFLEDGSIDFHALEKAFTPSTAAVLMQYPNFFGSIDSVSRVTQMAKKNGALSIICANPLVYALYQSASELGADIAVGDCQPFGLPMHFGGPYAGYMACKQEFLRQLPGRIVGETKDSEGKRGFVLTLQTREQHIRREKATSNICTNQALAALAALVTLIWYGKKGLRKLALTNYQRARYLHEKLLPLTASTPFSKTTFFNEFVIKFNQPLDEVQKYFRSQGIEPGLNVEAFYPELKQCLLVAITETKSKAQLDKYIETAQKLV